MDYHVITSSFVCQPLLDFLKQNSAGIFTVRHKRKWLTNPLPCIIIIRHLRECWNGRQARLRCVWLRRVGSSPISRTKKELILSDELFFGAMISVPCGNGWYSCRYDIRWRGWYTLRVWRERILYHACNASISCGVSRISYCVSNISFYSLPFLTFLHYIMLAAQVYHAVQSVYHIASAIYHWKNSRNAI